VQERSIYAATRILGPNGLSTLPCGFGAGTVYLRCHALHEGSDGVHLRCRGDSNQAPLAPLVSVGFH
jgi:hypothetical protein